jgi:integrase
MAHRITKRLVDSVQAQAREQFLFDTELPGFGLRVSPKGQKSYIVQYRAGAGRAAPKRRVTLGRHGVLTPDEARRLAKTLLAEVAQGIDPAVRRRNERNAPSVAELCDWYLAEGIGTKKASTIATDRGRIERHIKPLLGSKRVQDVSVADVERFMRSIAEGKTAIDIVTGPRGRARVTGGKGTAARTVGLLGGIMTFAVQHGLRPDNPVHGVERYRDRHNERFLTAAELGRLGEALSEAEEKGANPLAIAIIRLLALTGCRRGEIEALRWSEIDFEWGCLRLTDGKTGARVVQLGAPALKLLAALQRLGTSPWVFPATSGTGFFEGTPKVWKSIRQRAGLSGVRLHDLRHSYASFGVAGGNSLFIIGRLLGHRDLKTTNRYAHLGDDPLRTGADRIARQVADALLRDTG